MATNKKRLAKHLLHYWMPPAALALVKKWIFGFGYYGNYTNWEDAKASSTGYNTEEILNKTKQALIQVRSGEAVYERDSVLFDKIQHSWPLLACLEKVANENQGNLSVLDFGGSLGSSYYQCRSFLQGLKTLEWSIVEQPQYILCGKKEFEDDSLKFYSTVEECLNQRKPNVLLLACVLPYLEKPYDVLSSMLKHEIENIIIDRTPFVGGDQDVITVQKVSKQIYKASYPAWFLSYRNIVTLISQKYEIKAEFDALGKPVLLDLGTVATWKGLYGKTRSGADTGK